MKTIKKAVILAAGLGTRFSPITKSIPKEMLPILDKPTIHYIVEEVVKSHINQILIVVSSYKDSIVDYFDSSYELERRLFENGKEEELQKIYEATNLANILYIRQKEPLGLGHAILTAEQFVGDEPFVALTGDDYIYTKDNTPPATLQCINLFKKTNKMVVGVQKVSKENISKHGIVDPAKIDEKDGSILLNGIVEKPDPENAPSDYGVMGRYVLTPEIFKYLRATKRNAKNEIEITDALMKCCKSDQLYAKIFKGKRFDIGSKLGLIEATIFMGLLNKSIHKDLEKILEKYYLENQKEKTDTNE